MNEFKSRLQALIDSKKISQRDVAEKLDVNEARVSEWLAGKVTSPRRTTIIKLAHLFDCDINWLADGSWEPFPTKIQKARIGAAHFKKTGVSPLAVMSKEPAGTAGGNIDVNEEIKRLTEEISSLPSIGIPESIKDKYPSQFNEEDERVFSEWFKQPRNVLTTRLNKLLTQKFIEDAGRKLALVAENAVREMSESFFPGVRYPERTTARQFPPEETTDSQFTDSDLLVMTAKVLKSKTTYQPALKSDVRAFYRAILNGDDGLADKGDQTSDSDLLIMTSKVLESATFYRSALVSNILAFHQAVQGEEEMSDMRDEIAALRLEIQGLKEVIEAKFPEHDKKRDSQANE